MKYKELLNITQKREPFSKKEKATYTKQEQVFIRDIQVSMNMNKEKAIVFYKDYINASKRQRKKLRNKIEKGMTQLCRKDRNLGERNIKVKTKKQKKIEKFDSKGESFEDWNIRQRNERKARSSYYSRIVKGHSRYPTKSLKELRGH